MSLSLKRPAPKIFTPAERVAIVSEIHTRLKQGAKLDAIAPKLGIASTTYFTWLRRGVRPGTPPKRRPTTEELREKAARRYDDGRRQEILAGIERRTAAGETLKHVLADLDLGRSTYKRWLASMEPEPAFRAVAVVPDASPLALVPASPSPLAPPPVAALTLVSPGGYRLEGLDAASAVALLRALP